MRFSFLSLLAMQTLPLLLRPASVFLEGWLFPDTSFLVMVLPAAMLAFNISGVPVHIEFYKGGAKVDNSKLALDYYSSITWLLTISFFLFTFIIILLAIYSSATVMICIAMLFYVEKLSDESSRIMQYKKKFLYWFFIQVIRSGWLVIPIFIHFYGYSYSNSFMIFSLLVIIIMTVIINKTTGFFVVYKSSGIQLIYKNLPYLSGGILTGSFRQVPRMIVAKIFPQYSHAYLTISQVMQSASIIFNVRFQIPHRKLIALKPILYQRLVQRTMIFLIVPPAVMAAVYFFVPFITDLNITNYENIVFILFPIIFSEIIVYSVFAFHIGLLPWFESPIKLFGVSLVCVSFLFIIYFVGYLLLQVSLLKLTFIPALNVCVGLLWLGVIKFLSFRRT